MTPFEFHKAIVTSSTVSNSTDPLGGRVMNDLITEARELCAIDIENRPIHAEVIIDELCDALEKAENRIKLLEEQLRDKITLSLI